MTGAIQHNDDDNSECSLIIALDALNLLAVSSSKLVFIDLTALNLPPGFPGVPGVCGQQVGGEEPEGEDRLQRLLHRGHYCRQGTHRNILSLASS